MNKIPDPQDIEDIKAAIENMASIVDDVKKLLELSGHLYEYGKTYHPVKPQTTEDILNNLLESFAFQIGRIQGVINRRLPE